jgi:hypothetical protein
MNYVNVKLLSRKSDDNKMEGSRIKSRGHQHKMRAVDQGY